MPFMLPVRITNYVFFVFNFIFAIIGLRTLNVSNV